MVRRSTGRVLLLAVLLLAAFLRFSRLDAQSFWNDEGNSARIAERTLDLIVEGAAGDIHPPGYYLLLYFWRALAGQSEFALRSLSVAAGLLLVAFTYLLGRRLFGPACGLVAALLGAISPFAVYYAQEARMYALLGALSAASTYVFLRWVAGERGSEEARKRKSERARKRKNEGANQRIGEEAKERIGEGARGVGLLAAYVLLGAAGLYTQYAFPFVLLAHNAIFGLWWLVASRRWRRLAAWGAGQAIVAGLYLPWLRTALHSVTGWSPAGQPIPLGEALLDILRVLSVGLTLPLDEAALALVCAGVLLVVGLCPRRRARAGWLSVAGLALVLLLPIGLILGLDLYKAAWLKFLLVVSAPFHVIVARGVVNLARADTWSPSWARRLVPLLARAVLLTCSAVVLLATAASLRNLYFDPAYARDDYRQIAADISAAGTGGAVILNAPNQWEVFTYYYPDRDVYPAHYRPSPAGVETFLSPLVARYERLFVLYWGDAESDPRRLIETWLAANAYKVDDRWYGRVRLATYGTGTAEQEPAVALDARFGEAMGLRGYGMTVISPAPGDVLPVALFWETRAPVAERYKVTVQVLDATGSLVGQHDAEPGADMMSTTTWQAGQTVIDRHGVFLPGDLPPGRYSVVVAVYHLVTGERLPVTQGGVAVGDHLFLEEVTVGPDS